MEDRIVILIDMDCFYCQVEARLNPSLKGKPMAVVQYNQWKGGGIIAVNYEAREFGVTRSMRGDEAKKKCPGIELVHVPALRGKADLTKYRDAGREVADVLCQFSNCVQRASVDEAYIDITNTVDTKMKDLTQIQPSQLATTFVVGFCDSSNDEEKRLQGLTTWLDGIYGLQDETQMRLAVAGLVVEEMRAAVFEQTGFRCSAGIAHNKILGKLACGLHKPNRQTILPQPGVLGLFKTLPVRKVRNLGGKFGCMVEEQLGCTVMADILQFSEHQLQQRFDEKTGTWLYNIARGIDSEPVTPRLLSKSIGCCKKFPGRQALATKTDVEYWLHELAAEVAERLEKDLHENKRRAKLLCVSYMQDSSCSRSGPLSSYDAQRIASDAYDLLKKCNSANHDAWHPPLKFLGISAGKFVDESSNRNSTLLHFFKTAEKISNKSYIDKSKQGKSVTAISSRDPHSVIDRESDENSHCKEHIEDSNDNLEQLATKDTNKNGCETSSLKNSFFLRYLKQKAAGNIRQPSADNSDDDMFEKDEQSDSTSKKKSSDLNSEQKILSNSKSKLEDILPNETLSKNVTLVNFGASTSRVDDDADNLCVSLSEIFPDLDEVDNDVVELLPSPMQRRLRARRKNKGKRKLETKSISETENSSHAGDENGYDKQISSQSDPRINCQKESNPQARLQDLFEDDPNSPNEQRACKTGKSKEDIQEEDMEDSICEKENSPRHERHQKEESSNQNKHKTLKSLNDENGLRKRRIFSSDLDVINISDGENSVGKSSSTTEGNINNTIVQKCPECGKAFPLTEYLEHLDFHAAERLHKELNCAPQLIPCRMPTIEIPAKRKRGKAGKKQAAITVDKSLRSITAFFAPKR